MSIKRIAYMAAAVAAFNFTFAQELAKEITVDRIVVPDQRPVERPALMPSLIPIQQEYVSINAAEYILPGNISTCITHLPAAAWADSIAYTPYRGYASVGYFPALNIGANAGYKFLQKPSFQAGAWLQYNGYQYKRDGVKLRNNFFSIGADGAWKPNSYSRLSAKLEFDAAGILRPTIDPKDSDTRSANAFNGSINWESKYNIVFYNLSIGGSVFKFGNPSFSFSTGQEMKPITEKGFNFKGAVGTKMFGSNTLKIDFDGNFMHSDSPGTGSIGEMHLLPNYLFFWNDFTARLGANVSIATGYVDKGVNIAPDLQIAWAPANTMLAAYLNFGGGEELNKTSDIFAIDPYCTPFLSYSRYNIPLSVDAGVTLGKIAGFGMTIFGGWANAHHWLMPLLFNPPYFDIDAPAWASPYDGTIYTATNSHSWYVGAKTEYSYKSLFDVACSIATGGSDKDLNSWYQWRDRAKCVFQASAAAHPIDRLTVNVDYELRASRKGVFPTQLTSDIGAIELKSINLANISNLSIGGSYAVTEQLTGFLRIENLLNRRYLLISGLPAQGTKGLLGITYKF